MDDERRTVAELAADEMAGEAWAALRRMLFRDVTDAAERSRLARRYLGRLTIAATAGEWDDAAYNANQFDERGT